MRKNTDQKNSVFGHVSCSDVNFENQSLPRVQEEFNIYEILRKSLNFGVCRKSFNSKQAFVGHHNAKHTDNFKFDLCKKYFENLSKLDRHKMAHNIKEFHQPKMREEVFLRNDNMLQHVKNFH